MITTFISINMLGCYLLYLTSKRSIKPGKSNLTKVLSFHPPINKFIGIAFLLGSLILGIVEFGMTAGILSWLMTTSCLLGLIVLLTPINIIKTNHVMAMGILCMIFEICI